jgi:cytochrome c oxidase assembly factor CtaG
MPQAFYNALSVFAVVSVFALHVLFIQWARNVRDDKNTQDTENQLLAQTLFALCGRMRRLEDEKKVSE